MILVIIPRARITPFVRIVLNESRLKDCLREFFRCRSVLVYVTDENMFPHRKGIRLPKAYSSTCKLKR